MFDPRQYLALGCAITFKLIRNDDPRDVLQPLEQLTEKLLRRLFVASALHQDIEDVVILVDSAPEVMALTVDRQKHFIQVPLVTGLGASTLQLIGVFATLPGPRWSGFKSSHATGAEGSGASVRVANNGNPSPIFLVEKN